MSDFIVKFEKDNEYRRFLLTNIFTNLNRGMISLDMVEEVMPVLNRVIVHENGETSIERNENNIVNLVHSTAVVHPENLPTLINSLQAVYDRYLAEKFPSGGDSPGEK